MIRPAAEGPPLFLVTDAFVMHHDDLHGTAVPKCARPLALHPEDLSRSAEPALAAIISSVTWQIPVQHFCRRILIAGTTWPMVGGGRGSLFRPGRIHENVAWRSDARDAFQWGGAGRARGPARRRPHLSQQRRGAEMSTRVRWKGMTWDGNWRTEPGTSRSSSDPTPVRTATIAMQFRPDHRKPGPEWASRDPVGRCRLHRGRSAARDTCPRVCDSNGRMIWTATGAASGSTQRATARLPLPAVATTIAGPSAVNTPESGPCRRDPSAATCTPAALARACRLIQTAT